MFAKPTSRGVTADTIHILLMLQKETLASPAPAVPYAAMDEGRPVWMCRPECHGG